MFYSKTGRLKTAFEKTFTFNELRDLADADGVLRFFVAYKCKIMDCPHEYVAHVPKDIVLYDMIYGMPLYGCCFQSCTFMDRAEEDSPTVLATIDEQINELLDMRNKLKNG